MVGVTAADVKQLAALLTADATLLATALVIIEYCFIRNWPSHIVCFRILNLNYTCGLKPKVTGNRTVQEPVFVRPCAVRGYSTVVSEDECSSIVPASTSEHVFIFITHHYQIEPPEYFGAKFIALCRTASQKCLISMEVDGSWVINLACV